MTVTWLTSGPDPTAAGLPSPLFIYHVPKTGTTTVYAAPHRALAVAYAGRRQAFPDFEPPMIGRLDDPALLTESGVIEGRFGLVASHLPYGFHRRFGHDFQLMPLLREPFARIVSGYTYACMRAASAPTQDGFQAHFEAAENRNAATRQLGGSAEAAIDNLERDFNLFGTVEHIHTALERLLGTMNLPNVLIERLDATAPEYRLDLSPFRDTVRALNAEDVALFDHIAQSPRVPSPLPSRPPHPLSVLVRETDNNRQSTIETRVVPTGSLGNPGELPPEAFRHLFDGT